MVIPDQTDTAINLWRFTVYKTSDIGKKKNIVEAGMKAQESVIIITLLECFYPSAHSRPSSNKMAS